MSISGSQVAHASETNASRVVEEKAVANNTSSEISGGKVSTLEKERIPEDIDDKKVEKTKQTQDVEKPAEKKEQKENLTSESGEKALVKKEVNKKELKDLVDRIKKTDISKKTEKSVKELNLILSRAEKDLDNNEITQEEIDKEVKALKEVFDKVEDKPREDNKSEVKERVESKKDEKVNSEKEIKEKQQDNNTEDIARKHNEQITKVTETVTEIHSIVNQINYEFSESEKEIVKTAEKLSTVYNSDKYNEETIQKLLKEVIYLRNKVANRMTRAHSGRRDSRNGKLITGRDESGFRAISIVPIANKYDGKSTLTSEQKTELTYYNSDEVFSFFDINGKRGPGEKVYKITHGENTGKEDVTPYYVQRIGIVRGLENFPGLKLKLAYKGAPGKGVDIESGHWNVNNPAVGTAIFGVIGSSKPVAPGTYEIVIGANGKRPEIGNRNVATITYRYTIKPQSERNTVRDLTPTYVDDVRHLTETEKNALIEKFKAEHPNVVNRANHVDFDHAEVSADGTTMTIHFKDGFNPKTIQTNATNDVEAKHQSITAYFGDSKELYTNPRELVRSKTGHEVPTTATVTYKTPFNLQQAGTRNVVVTTTYQNGVTKDVTTPYTVLDFIGKQDKKINQNQSGELGDARNYVTVSNNSAVPSELTVRWKGGSTVDTSTAGFQHKEIEILRGNHLMKTVNIPVEIVDNIKPSITAPDSVLLTRLEGLPSEINISAQDNNKGVGLKDGTAVTVENLPAPLTYNASKSKIEINGVIPNNFQLGKSSIQVTVKAVDKKGNTATKNITFHIQSQTQKYTAVANPQIQEVSYGEAPDAGTSIQKNGLPTGTRYSWATQPSTLTGPGDKTGVVTVTYPDGSTDTVNVTVKVRKLSDEHIPTGKTITVNQNDSVTNDRLKAAVTVNNGGTSKVQSVTSAGNISTTNAGTQTIKATVTYLDNTTDPVDIPLEVKDVTAPTIQTPTDRQNWDLIALDRALPPIKVTSVDNNGGTGIKSTTLTGLPDFLVYDNASKTIKFKNGVQEVTKLPAGQDSKTYNVNIQVTDNSNNSSQRQVTITVKSMTTKYNATPNAQKQTVSYSATPDAGTSINKNGLPPGTIYTWATTPSTTTGPGEKIGVVTVTYPDGSKDTVNVTVNVRKLSDEYNVTGTEIVVNQDASVSNDDLKAKVTAVAVKGNANGTDKILTVVPKSTIRTANYGDQIISATVTFKDGTVKDVTIPLKVKDVTKPTIQVPAENINWEMTALDKTLPPMEVRAEDNAKGSGIKTISVTGLPEYLEYDKTTNSIRFKAGKQEVEKLPVNTPSKEFTLTIRVEDNAGNISEKAAKITVYSMSEKNNPTPLQQEVDNGHVPDPEASVNKTGLPEGTTVTWKTTPDVSTPGSHPGVALVHYPDGTEDEVEVPVTVKKQSDTFTPTAKEPNQTVRHNEVPDPEKSINTNDLPAGTKYSWSEQPDTSKPGSKTGKVLITYPDKSTEEVTVTVEVTPQKDEYDPQPKAQTVDNGTVPEARNSIGNIDKLPPNTRFEWKNGAPSTTEKGDHPGTVLVTYPDGTSEEVEVKVNVRQINANGTPEIQPEAPDFTGGVNTPDAPTNEIPDYTDPIGSTGVDENGNLIVPPIVEAPDFTGGVNAPDAPISEVPEYTDPIGSTGVDGNGNLIIPPSVDIPEFMGGTSTPDAPTHEFSEFNGNIAINGELPEPAQLPKVKLIITKWVDENGNELKPADAKTPKVLGEENEAFEHGEIEGYEFVRTEVDENGEVVTHIFRKVTSSGVTQTNDNVKPEQTPDALHVPTNETHAQPEKDEVKQKETQTTLPKTGTANSLGLLSVATSSILFGLGFFILSKKEDEE